MIEIIIDCLYLTGSICFMVAAILNIFNKYYLF